MSDPRYPDAERRRGEYLSSNAMWGWVAGIAVLALVAIFLIAGSGTNEQMAQDKGPPAGSPSTTTGQAPSAVPAAPNQARESTVPPLGTTGQSGAASGQPGSIIDKNDGAAQQPGNPPPANNQ